MNPHRQKSAPRRKHGERAAAANSERSQIRLVVGTPPGYEAHRHLSIEVGPTRSGDTMQYTSAQLRVARSLHIAAPCASRWAAAAPR